MKNTFLKLLAFFVYITYSSYSWSIVISPPFVHFENNESELSLSIINNSEIDAAIYVEVEYKEDTSIYLITNTDTFLIPSNSTEKLKVKLMGIPKFNEEELMYLHITQLMKASDVDSTVSRAHLTITTKLKVIVTPKGIGKSALKVSDNKIMNTGPRFVQLLSLICKEGREIKNTALINPFKSASMIDECDPVKYKESRYGKPVVESFL